VLRHSNNNIGKCICAKTSVINKQMFLLFISNDSNDRQFIVIKQRTDIFMYNLIIMTNKSICCLNRINQLISIYSDICTNR
jgi:hypothetical protein